MFSTKELSQMAKRLGVGGLGLYLTIYVCSEGELGMNEEEVLNSSANPREEMKAYVEKLIKEGFVERIDDRLIPLVFPKSH